MPKLRMTEQQRREKSLRAAVEKGKVECGFDYDYQLAEAIGVKCSTYSDYKSQAFQKMDVELFGRMARTLHMSGREVCSAIGVPYDQ